MPMLVIAGEYQALRSQPDGDSVRFYPTDPAEWRLVPGPHAVEPNTTGGAGTRFDGIDALETHYPSKNGVFDIVHQPLPLGRRAAQEVLDWLGFINVVRNDNETVTASTPERVPGYLLTRGADINGRCVSFIFRGAPPAASGTSIFFGVDELRASLNHHLLAQGLVYPTYYTKLFFDIRDEMTRVAEAARQARLGIWAEDVTNEGFELASLATVFDEVVILPKLFRRLLDYLALNDGSLSLAGFKRFLEARNDRLFILSTGHATGFDFVVDVSGQRVSLNRRPEEFVFVEA